MVSTHPRTFARTSRAKMPHAACNVHRLSIVEFLKTRIGMKTIFQRRIISRIHAVTMQTAGFPNANIDRFFGRIRIINVRVPGGGRFAEQVFNFRARGMKYALTEFQFFEKLLHLECAGPYAAVSPFAS